MSLKIVTNVNVQGGGVEPFETFNYEDSHDGSIVSYSDYDAKWVYDNVILPEINLWPNVPKVHPIIDPLDPRLLKYGVGSDGLNHFGNLQRFTDEDGLQVFGNGVMIDHLTGFMHAVDGALADVWEVQLADVWDNFNALTLDKWFVSSVKIYALLSPPYNTNLIPSAIRVYAWLPIPAGILSLMCSTTRFNLSTQSYRIITNAIYNFSDVRNKDDSLLHIPKIVTRKAFKYDPITDKMILDL